MTVFVKIENMIRNIITREIVLFGLHKKITNHRNFSVSSQIDKCASVRYNVTIQVEVIVTVRSLNYNLLIINCVNVVA